MSEPTYHVHPLAFCDNERSDWAVQNYLNAEAETDYFLDRAILTDRGQLDQTYKYWVIITKLADSNDLSPNSSYADYALGHTLGGD